MFGVIDGRTWDVESDMPTVETKTLVREELGAPADAPTEELDVRNLGPPKPLKNTLEALAELDDDVVLVQLNDRAPQHLYPKLDDRGYEYETGETEGVVVTAIWKQ
jgi:uncharacterized protein (DUF2249 family)